MAHWRCLCFASVILRVCVVWERICIHCDTQHFRMNSFVSFKKLCKFSCLKMLHAKNTTISGDVQPSKCSPFEWILPLPVDICYLCWNNAIANLLYRTWRNLIFYTLYISLLYTNACSLLFIEFRRTACANENRNICIILIGTRYPTKWQLRF